MKQTVTVTPEEAKKEEMKYPYFGQMKCGCMVFFIAPKTGVKIHDACPNSQNPISVPAGDYDTDWMEQSFTPIVGTITITQE